MNAPDAGALRESILAYGEQVGFPLADVYVVDGSRRSTKANAFFTGVGRHRRIALFDTLLDALDPGAVIGVVAHEVGHWKLGHVPRGMALGILQLGAFFLLPYAVFLLHAIASFAVYDYRAQPSVTQEHQVLREGQAQRLVGHRVPAVLDHHGLAVEPVQPGQRLDQRGRLGRGVLDPAIGQRHVEYAEFSCT